MSILRSNNLLSKINIIDAKINDPTSTLSDIKQYILEMKTIVRHAKLVYYKSQEILDNNIKLLKAKINNMTNEDDEEEYSADWIEFMHKEYIVDEKDDDILFQDQKEIIKITKNLSIKDNTLITVDDDKISLKLHQLMLTTCMSEIENLSFEYSPDIIKQKNKNKRHLGPIKTLESDLARLEKHKTLFKEEKNKIKNHIVYNILLYLLLKE
jgi:hypothetical protein